MIKKNCFLVDLDGSPLFFKFASTYYMNDVGHVYNA